MTKRGDQDRDVGHAAPARRRSSASADTIAAPSAALDFGAGPPRTCSTNTLSCARSGSSPGVSMRASSGSSVARARTRTRARPRRPRARRRHRRSAARRVVRAPETRDETSNVCHAVAGVEMRAEADDVAVDDLADRRARRRDRPEHLERDGEIVRREHPDGVDVVVRDPPAEARRRDSGHRAEPPVSGDRGELDDTRVIAPLVHDEERAGRSGRQPRRRVGIVGQRLLAEDRNARARGRAPRARHACSSSSRRRRRRAPGGRPRRSTIAAAPPSRARATLASERATTGTSQPSVFEIAEDVTAPPAAADEAYDHAGTA